MLNYKPRPVCVVEGPLQNSLIPTFGLNPEVVQRCEPDLRVRSVNPNQSIPDGFGSV